MAATVDDERLAALEAGAEHDSVTAERLRLNRSGGFAFDQQLVASPVVSYLRSAEQPHFLFTSRFPVAIDGSLVEYPGNGAVLVVTDHRALLLLGGTDDEADWPVSFAHSDRPTVSFEPRQADVSFSPLDDEFDATIEIRTPVTTAAFVPTRSLGYDDLFPLGDYLDGQGWSWADEDRWADLASKGRQLVEFASRARGDSVTPERLAAIGDQLPESQPEFFLSGGEYQVGSPSGDWAGGVDWEGSSHYDWLLVTAESLLVGVDDGIQQLPVPTLNGARIVFEPPDGGGPGVAALRIGLGERVHQFEAAESSAAELQAIVEFLRGAV